MSGPDYRQQEELEERRWNEEMDLLRQDSENWWAWCQILDDQTYEERE